MTAEQEQLITDLEDIKTELDTIERNLGPALSGALDDLEASFFAPPAAAMGWLRGRANTAVNDFNACVGSARDYCDECIQNTRHCFLLRHTESLYRAVSFSDVTTKTDPGTIAGDAATHWESENRAEYLGALEELQGRTELVKNSVESLITSIDHMATAIENRDTDILIAAAGVYVGLVGIAITLVTGFSGWGAIAGVIVTVIGIALSIWGFIRAWTTVPARRDEMIEELRSNASGNSAVRWPAPPRLTDTDW